MHTWRLTHIDQKQWNRIVDGLGKLCWNYLIFNVYIHSGQGDQSGAQRRRKRCFWMDFVFNIPNNGGECYHLWFESVVLFSWALSTHLQREKKTKLDMIFTKFYIIAIIWYLVIELKKIQPNKIRKKANDILQTAVDYLIPPQIWCDNAEHFGFEVSCRFFFWKRFYIKIC